MKTLGKRIGVETVLVVLYVLAHFIVADNDTSTEPPGIEANSTTSAEANNITVTEANNTADNPETNSTNSTGLDPGALNINGTKLEATGPSESEKKVGASEFTGPAAWLRICEPGAGKYVGVVKTSSQGCPAGYWFKQTLKVGCACGHGVWVFARGWCDHDAKIIVAYNGSCFNVNKDVKYVRHIGWSHNAFMPFHFVGSSGMEYIQEVPDFSTLSRGATYFNYEYNQHVGAVNRGSAVESMTGRFCFSQEGNTSRPLSMKYFVPKLPYLQQKNCFGYAFQDGNRFEYDAGYELKEGLKLVGAPTMPFEKPKSWATEPDAEKCAMECPIEKGKTSAPKPFQTTNISPDYLDPNFDEYFLEELREMGWNDTSALPAEMPEQNISRYYTLTDKTAAEIQEQTKRILQLNLMSSLQNIVTPGVKYADYKLLQKSRAIFDKVCPEEEFPSAILTGMLRMFRLVVNESFFHYPYEEFGNWEETLKIFNVLDTCSREARPMTFVYSKSNDNNGIQDAFSNAMKYAGFGPELNVTNNAGNITMSNVTENAENNTMANVTDNPENITMNNATENPDNNTMNNATNNADNNTISNPDNNTISDLIKNAGNISIPFTIPSIVKCEKKDKGKFIGVDYEFNIPLKRTIMAKLPAHLLFNITDLDLVVETAWKTVMFSHYYCARHFQAESISHSLFTQKMEKFFNRWIQHRWYYPGTSYKGYKYLYQTYDLDQFTLAMDRCVAASRSFSLYRKWIQRPVYTKFMGGKLFKEQYDIPDKVAGRTELDAMNPELNQFNNKAYCLPFWHSPASNPGLNYNPENDYQPGCVKYRTEEWENPFKPLSRKGEGWKNDITFL